MTPESDHFVIELSERRSFEVARLRNGYSLLIRDQKYPSLNGAVYVDMDSAIKIGVTILEVTEAATHQPDGSLSINAETRRKAGW